MKYAGMSNPYGITFFGEKYKCTISEPFHIFRKPKNKILNIKVSKKRHYEQYYLFIALFIFDILIYLREYVGKFLLWIVLSSIPLIKTAISYLPSDDAPVEPSNIPVLSIEIMIIIAVIFELLWLTTVFTWAAKSGRYHGAEHKTISAAENNDLENTVNYSRIHPKCGTNLMPLYIIYSIITLLVFSIPLSGTSMLLSMMNVKNLPSARLFSERIGSKLQLLTTKEPKPEQLQNAIYGMKVLNDAEENGVYINKWSVNL